MVKNLLKRRKRCDFPYTVMYIKSKVYKKLTAQKYKTPKCYAAADLEEVEPCNAKCYKQTKYVYVCIINHISQSYLFLLFTTTMYLLVFSI